MVSLVVNETLRSITCSSSRIFPGQLYPTRSFKAFAFEAHRYFFLGFFGKSGYEVCAIIKGYHLFFSSMEVYTIGEYNAAL